jgi:N-acetylmuramoyl-L-alanine amidase
MSIAVRNHRLAQNGSEVNFFESPNIGGQLTPGLLTMHYTASDPASDIARYFLDPGAKVSAHVTIRRDGSIGQSVLFNRIAWHAGNSTWRCRDGVLREGLNNYSIGIELENWGPIQKSAAGWVSWTGVSVDPARVVEARHRFGTPDCGWETFSEQQIQAAIETARAICTTYEIKEIVGHDDISPGRKSDPGPAFAMESFRARVFGRAEEGGSSMTVRSDAGLNLRKGPGVNFDLVRPAPLANGTIVRVHQAEGAWRFVSTVDAQGEPQLSGWVNSNWLAA